MTSCSPHNNAANYVESNKGNRIVVHCRVCGRFIGYKAPEKQSTKQTK